jgi:hypothetical protein
VQPKDVASGYVLFNPGYRRRAYEYDSDWGDATELKCDRHGCVVVDKWQTQVHEYINGGSSKSWVLKLNARHVSGSDQISFDYWYACAINVSGDPDHYCATGHGADPSQVEGVMDPRRQLYKHFERNSYSNTEYPMAAIGVHFEHSSTMNKDRLADVCVTRSSASLCNKTGDGKGGTHTW